MSRHRSYHLSGNIIAAVTFIIVQGITILGLALRRSSHPRILDYSVGYFLLILLYIAIAIGVSTLLLKPNNAFIEKFNLLSKWLKKHWVILLLLFVVALELWYAFLPQSRRFFFPAPARRIFNTALLLSIFWVFLTIIFAGKSTVEKRDTAVNLIFALISSLFGFWLFAQLYVITNPALYKNYQQWGKFVRYNYQLGYTGKPELADHQPGWCPSEAEGVTYSTDQLGFRNELNAEFGPIAAVGDSVTFGWCVGFDDIWTTQLGNYFGASVANYSLPGMSMWHYNKYIENYVVAQDFDYVMYTIVPNDIFAEPDYDHSLYERLMVTNILWNMSPVNEAFAYILTKAPSQHIQDAFKAKSTDIEIIARTVELDNGMILGPLVDPYRVELQASSVFERLSQAIELANNNDFELVVITTPSLFSVYDEAYAEAFPDLEYLSLKEHEIYTQICDHLHAQGVLCYDPTVDMREAAEDLPALFLNDDGHFNVTGNRVFAELIAAYLKSNTELDY